MLLWRIFREKAPFSALGAVLVLLILGGIASPLYGQTDGNGVKKDELERQIAALEEEAAKIDETIQGIRGEAQSLSNEIATIDAEVRRRQIEIRRLDLAIQKANLEIKQKEVSITDLTVKINRSRRSLASTLLLLYARDQENIISVLIKNASISDFLGALFNLNRLRATIQTVLGDFKSEHALLEKEKEELKEFEKEQLDLKALQEVERRFLAQKKKEKDELLRLTKGKEAIFQQLLKAKKKDITSLRTQLFYLEKTGITAEEALKFVELAAKRAGIRPAFLLALLEVETGRQFEEGVISVGSNVGTGNWRDDMYLCYQRLGRYYGGASIAKYNSRAERERTAFFQITEELGLDPDKMPVSKEPPYVGCGGAMGPAQFIPTTWMIYRNRVAELTGHNPPNPWNVEDAFTAAAIFLADAGAASQTAAGETRAAKTYLSGSPTCSRYVCRSYASRILSLARDIERIL